MPGASSLTSSVPFTSVRSPGGMVASADQLATQAGLIALALGGNAVDAAIATNAAIAVTAPHLCGLGGDLFALVHIDGAVHALNSTGRAGSASDPDALRAEGHTSMPFRHDIRTVTVPGCVDGWIALHERYGSLPLSDLLAPAIDLAEGGFPASPLLVGSLASIDAQGREALHELASQATRPGARVRRHGVGRTLRAISDGGRAAFYDGEFGAGLRALAGDLFSADDLHRRQSEWVAPLRTRAWGVDLWTLPPNSQGYLILAAAALADGLDLPTDPDDPQWAHLLIEAATAVGHDRPQVLHDGADGDALVRERAARGAMVDSVRASRRPVPGHDGDTTYLCTTDRHGNGVSLIQSNASGFGSWIVEPTTGINLHNRGLGFSLEPGHPAEPLHGRRPPHTLCPAMATNAAAPNEHGSLRAVFGTMGGDAQPQIVLQVAARLFAHEQSPAVAINSGRWTLRGPVTGFDTWTAPQGPLVEVEGNAPAEWATALEAKGHTVVRSPAFDSGFGHAHAIVRDDEGFWSGAADPRTRVGSVAGR